MDFAAAASLLAEALSAHESFRITPRVGDFSPAQPRLAVTLE